MKEVQPTLSLRERDRRWGLVKELLKENELECLIVGGLWSREEWDGYLTNDSTNGILVFPLEGEPTYLPWAMSRVIRNLENVRRGGTSWVKKWRAGATGQELIAVLKDGGFHSASIGVVGVETRSPQQPEGFFPYKTWSYVLENLPKATFIDISIDFAKLMMVKSEEELELLRYSAAIGEKACEALLNITKAGVSESEMYGTIMNVIFSNGAGVHESNLCLHTGVDNLSWGAPMWMYHAQTPRVIQKGEIVGTEIFVVYGGLETQQQMCVAIEPVHPIIQECAQVARQAYEAGLKALRPGRNFQEVVAAIEAPINKGGCWHLMPLIHNLSPIGWAGPSSVGLEDEWPELKNYQGGMHSGLKSSELVIEPGMVFALEPDACRGRKKVQVGGTVIVTENGAEELNKLPTEMRIVN